MAVYTLSRELFESLKTRQNQIPECQVCHQELKEGDEVVSKKRQNKLKPQKSKYYHVSCWASLEI